MTYVPPAQPLQRRRSSSPAASLELLAGRRKQFKDNNPIRHAQQFSEDECLRNENKATFGCWSWRLYMSSTRLSVSGRDGPLDSWSLGGPSAEAVKNGTKPSEEALEWRTRRTHCGRPCDNPGVTACCLPRSPFGGAMLVVNCVGKTWSFGRSRERAGGGTGHMRCWHRSTVRPEVVVRQG